MSLIIRFCGACDFELTKHPLLNEIVIKIEKASTFNFLTKQILKVLAFTRKLN